MTSVTPELGRESPMRDAKSAFGFDAAELLTKLNTDEEFASTFMEQYAVLQSVVKDFKTTVKEAKTRAREDAKYEKEQAERERLTEVITKIQEKDPEVVLEPEAAGDNFFEGSSIQYLKQWVKNYRTSVKNAKAAEKQAKADAKTEKEAEKQAKADAKAEKEDALREKLLSQMPKLIEMIDYEPEYDEETITLKEIKIIHARVKMLGQLKKYNENVDDIPDVEEETIEHDELKSIHARAKLINQHNRLFPDDTLTYPCDKTLENIKEFIKENKDN